MLRSIVILPSLFQVFVLSKPVFFNEESTILGKNKNGKQLDPDTFRDSITYCSPIVDNTPCTEGESPNSKVHHYLNANHTAHFECFITDPVVGSVLHLSWPGHHCQADTGVM
jgi:hypothetical protein